MRRQVSLAAVPLLAWTLAACQMVPATGREGFNIVPPAQEAAMGAEAHPDILKEFGGAYDDPLVQAYVAGIGQRLGQASATPAADFRFTVLDSPIVNAMALPGGYVYVTRGLLVLADNEAELAGVLAHEIGHVTARHSSQRISRAAVGDLLAGVVGAVVGVPGVGDIAQLGAGAYLQSFSRDQETEADQLGIATMSQAGYDPHAMASFLDKLYQQSRLEALLAGRSPDDADQFNFMASHPRTKERVQAAAAATAGAVRGGAQGRDELLAHVDGVTYGSDPKQGIIRERVFLHPDLGIRFEVPTGFTLVNGEDKVTASSPKGGAIQFDTDQGSGDMTTYLGQRWGAKLRLSGVEAIDVNGLPAATAKARVQSESGPADVRLVAVDGGGGTVYRFLFISKANDASFDEAYKRTTYSLRRLTTQESAAIRPLKVDVVTVRSDDSAESLAARMAAPDHKLERFRVLNGMGGGQALPAKVKLVVEG
ncbi:MAG: M48 family metalloprotease [Rhodospirillaceae bacterium]|nr:M48 family metalloprotease [Rhodospirillales bacterium]